VATSGTILLQDTTGIQDLTPYVSKFVYKNSVLLGHSRWKLFFNTSDWAFWKDLMIGNGLRFSIKVIGEKNGSKSETDWLNLVVDFSDGGLRSTQMKGFIEGGGAELTMMEEEKRKAYANTTASQIFQLVAAQYSLIPDVGSSSFVDTWYQANQTDWNFLQEVIDDYVSAQDNRGDAYLNIDGQNLVVKPINFALPSTRKYDLTQSDDRVTKVQFKYYGGQVTRSGIVVEARGFDRGTGLAVSFSASPVTAPSAALADKLPETLTGKKKVILTSSSSLEYVRIQALRAQAKYGNRYYGMAVRAANDLTVKLREMFEISMQDGQGSGAFTEGRYGIYEYIIDYRPTRIETNIIGYRREAYTGPQVAVGAPASQSVGVDQYRVGAGNFAPTTLKSVPLGT
jgi:hypothetical protein